jgi:glycosyltransferase involved in cell wall biosynthesis
MKKILFFIESLECGGAERSLLSLLNNLDYRDYEVHLMLGNKGGSFEKFVPKNLSIKHITISISLSSRVSYKFRRILNFKKYHNAQLLWESVKNDIPYVNDTFDVAIAWGQGFATYFVAERITANKKYAWINTDYEKAGYKFKLDENKYLKFDKIVGISEFVVNIMSNYIMKSKLLAIRNIIDKEEILKRAEINLDITNESSTLNIVSVGRLVKLKGFNLAILAAKKLLEQKIIFKWYIIGEGEERKNLEQLINKHNLTEKVVLLGLKDNPYPYIKNCDIYVQTSLFEGLGRTLMEAHILCKPIVSTNFPTAHYLIENELTGFITNSDANEIAKKIILLNYDKTLYVQMVQRLSIKPDIEKEKILREVYNLLT